MTKMKPVKPEKRWCLADSEGNLILDTNYPLPWAKQNINYAKRSMEKMSRGHNKYRVQRVLVTPIPPLKKKKQRRPR